MPASGSEWGSDNDSNDSEYEVSENHAKEQRTGEVSGDESEDIGSEDESPESEDDAAMAEAAKAAAEKAAKKKAKPKAKAKAKAEDPPKGTPKGTPKKPKVVSGGAATTATPPKKDESAKPKPKPKTARKAELFENEPLRNGTRNGMPPEKEADTFWAWNLAEAERQKASLEAFVANASAEKGKQTKGLVAKFNGDPSTGEIMSPPAREIVKRRHEESQNEFAILAAATGRFEKVTGATVRVQIELPGKKARRD